MRLPAGCRSRSPLSRRLMKTPSTMDQDELPYKVKFTVEQYTAPHDIVISGVAPRALYGILKNISNNFDFSVDFTTVF
jgi:hypothetical protein